MQEAGGNLEQALQIMMKKLVEGGVPEDQAKQIIMQIAQAAGNDGGGDAPAGDAPPAANNPAEMKKSYRKSWMGSIEEPMKGFQTSHTITTMDNSADLENYLSGYFRANSDNNRLRTESKDIINKKIAEAQSKVNQGVKDLEANIDSDDYFDPAKRNTND